MRSHQHAVAALLSLAASAWLASGCATTGAASGDGATPVAAAPSSAPRGWWNIDIYLAFDPGNAPHWTYDLICADRLLHPTYLRYQRNVPVWWFHRRAAPDQWGHIFSLYFSADVTTAAAMYDEVQRLPLFVRLKEQGRIKKAVLAPESRELNTSLDGVVDASWPIELRRSWPDYGMGISGLWYDLVVEGTRKEPAPGPDASFEELDAHYAKANEFVTAVWEAFGHHSMLHHAAAMFGYVPLPIRF
jgi:hypothetical protein